MACLEVIDPTTNSPFPWSKFQGFGTYEEAATYLGWFGHPQAPSASAAQQPTSLALSISTPTLANLTALPLSQSPALTHHLPTALMMAPNTNASAMQSQMAYPSSLNQQTL
eukprot:15347278-Ditylum_brightwellii.AAC.1